MSKDNTVQLKPCPFCGSEAVYGAVDNNYYIRCGDLCEIRPTTALTKYYSSFQDAANIWNLRADSVAKDEYEEMRDVLEGIYINYRDYDTVDSSWWEAAEKILTTTQEPEG